MSRDRMASCIECGEVTALLLEPRFPHICRGCLFPPPKPEDPTADPPQLTRTTDDVVVTRTLQPMTLVAKLLRAQGNGSFYSGDYPDYWPRGKPRSDAP